MRSTSHGRRLPWCSIALVWSALCGCGSTPPPDTSLRGELGTGITEFLPIEDGDTLALVRGCQGAQHVVVSLRTWGIAADRPIVDLELVRDRDGAPVSAPFRVRVTLTARDGEDVGSREVRGLTLVVPEVDQALGERLTLRASAIDELVTAPIAPRAVTIAWGTGGGCRPIDPPPVFDAAVEPRIDGGMPPATDGGSTAGIDAASPGPAPRFTDVTERAGLAAPHLRPERCVLDVAEACEIDAFTGGAAAGDVDGDGWPDLYLTMLEGPARLYRNLGDGTFADVSASAGLTAHVFHSNGAAFVDVESDGDLDLYVTSIGNAGDPISARHYLFLNDGAGHFTEDAVARGVALDDGRVHAGQSVATGDYDRDGYPDLHVTEWLVTSSPRPHTRLLHNLGAAAPGRFEDSTRAAGVLTFSEPCWDESIACSQYAFASAFSDLDDDGWPDLVVVIDFALTRSFWNRGDGTFAPGLTTRSIDGDENGMGSTIGDVDGDGDLDWFVTAIRDPDFLCAMGGCNWGSSGNRLYRNAGGRTLVDATDETGVRNAGWAWGSALFDADNDGDLDLVATAGIDLEGTDFEIPFHDDPTRLWVNDGGGRMREVGAEAGIADAVLGKGLLVLDFDRDGALDVLVLSNGAPPHLYRNEAPSQSYLRVDLRPANGGAEALGARVWARTTASGARQVREIASSSHYLGQSERTAHFGLGVGVTRVAELEVRWPSGRWTRLTDVEANRTIELREPPL